MRRLLPRSLAGQMVLLLGLALLVAQIVNFALILNERQKLSLARNERPALARFAGVAADAAQAPPEFREAVLLDNSRRGARFAIEGGSGIADAERDSAVEARLLAAMKEFGESATSVRATSRTQAPERGRTPERAAPGRYLHLAVQIGYGEWLTARINIPRGDPYLGVRLAAATLALYLIVLGATVWLARRIARPLRDLTVAAERFQGRADPEPVVARGPDDLRLAIEAFNAMNARVVTLIDEKDRMLGAIGHDLRTPLASLRIRVESMEPEEEREAAVAKIEETNAMLEDILVLARSGRAREPARQMDVAALAEAVADEYQDRGQAVIFDASGRAVAAVQPNLLRRALHNLIDNALSYAGNARLAVRAVEGGVELRVMDDGPGIPADQLAHVLQPFHRLEGSRNRNTGGSGLGLAIAQNIVESHGGRLTLSNAQPHGLVATVFLPS